MTYDEIVKGIKDLTIQGAEKIAIAAVDAFSQKIAETKDREQLKKYMDELISLRETEPALRNALKYCFEN
ncbi:MAG: hypothetical protein WCT36_01245, partial [Candidatus Gracilibacteria bacterium]